MTGNLCESRFGALYATGVDRLGHPIGLMVGLQLLKHTCNVSDEEVVATWVENPYWQYFCGEQYFRHDLPIDPSLMTGFRKRIGQAGCQVFAGGGEWRHNGTRQGRHIPRRRTVCCTRHALRCQRQGIDLRQSYERIGKAAFVRSQRYAHARQINRANAQTRKLRT